MGQLIPLLLILPLGLIFSFGGVAREVADFRAAELERCSWIMVND